MEEMLPKEAAQKISDATSAVLIDVRTPGEFSAIHATPAINLPVDNISDDTVMQLSKGRAVFFICKGGNRSKRACQAYTGPSVSVSGGTDSWVAAGLPVVRAKGVIALERQVRIAAGTMVLLGVVLGSTVHSSLYGIAGFVGAGLLFAGVSDWCGMAMLLAKMPWNRKASHSSCSVKVQ